MLDELGLERQAALELKLKAALHQGILWLVKRKSRIKIKVRGVGQECPTTRYDATASGPMNLGRWTLRLRSGRAAEGGCPHMALKSLGG